MQHDIKHWVLQVAGISGYLTFETAHLHMGSREAYTLNAENIAVLTSAFGDPAAATPVSVPNPAALIGAQCRVFRVFDNASMAPLWTGSVSFFRGRREGGKLIGNRLTAAGAWHFLDRIVYTQPASVFVDVEDVATVRQTSRIVLGQSPSGSPISFLQQLYNFASFLFAHAPAGKPTPKTVEVGIPTNTAFTLPFDEMRDATVAQCLDRILRYIPGVIVAQRNGADRQTVHIFTDQTIYSADATAYMDGGKILHREDTVSDNAISGVRVEIQKTGSADGRAVSRMEEQLAPVDGTPGPGWMYVTLQLSAREASRSTARLDMETEDFPADLNSSAWWLSRLGESTLKNVVALEITDAARSGAADHPEWYPRIALNASPVEITAAGLRSRVEKITCNASYTLNDEAGNLHKIIEERPLEIEIVTTSAKTRPYTWTTSLSVSAAEPTPVGYAQALLDQHAQDGRSITAHIRLPIGGEPEHYLNPQYSHAGLPGPGDKYDGLVCQTADYDLAAHTVKVVFGPPSHVSPQDLASLMVGGRTRKTCSVTATALTTGELGEDEVDGAVVAAGGAGAAGDGKMTRLVIPKTGSGEQSKIDIDPAKIGGTGPSTIEPREITYVVPDGAGTLQAKKGWIMASEEEDEGSQITVGGIPDGTKIPQTVFYEKSGTPRFVQYELTWSTATNTWVKSATAKEVTTLESHSSQHA